MKLLLLLGCAFLLLVLLEKVYRIFWCRHLEVKIQFQEQSSVEGEKAFLTETIENRKWLPLAMLQVEFLVDNGLGLGAEENASKSDKQYKRDVFTVSFYQKISRKIEFTCHRRGYYEVGLANLTARGIRMDTIYHLDIPQNTYLYVYPRKVSASRIQVPLKRLGGLIEQRKGMMEDPFAFAGIREYDGTDPMNKINWKASAKSGNLMVNIQNSTYSAKAACFLDVEDVSIWKHREVHEDGIRLAASLLCELIRKDVPVALYSNGRDLLSGEPVRVRQGNGKGQMEKINRALSRLDLKDKKKITPIQEFLKDRKEELEMVILITESQNKELIQQVRQDVREGIAFLWIQTFYKEDFYTGERIPGVEYVRWEVEHER